MMFYGQCTLCAVDDVAFIILKPFSALIISSVAREINVIPKNHVFYFLFKVQADFVRFKFFKWTKLGVYSS